MKIVITGSTGFIGQWLYEYLRPNHDLTGFCCASKNELKQNLFKLPSLGRSHLIEAFKNFTPDVVIHLAAQSSPAISWKDPYNTVGDNVLMTINLLECAEIFGFKLIIASSSEVYDIEEFPLTEESHLKPRNPYAVSKLTIDYLTQIVAPHKKINVTLLRLFNTIGPKQSEIFVISTFAKQLAEIKLGLKENIISVGNLDAERDFVDIRDTIRAFNMFLNIEEYGGFYNVSSGSAKSIRYMLDQLIEISNLDVEVKIDPERMRPSDIPLFLGSYEKIYNKVGWEPQIPLEQTLSDVYKYWLKKLKE